MTIKIDCAKLRSLRACAPHHIGAELRIHDCFLIFSWQFRLEQPFVEEKTEESIAFILIKSSLTWAG